MNIRKVTSEQLYQALADVNAQSDSTLRFRDIAQVAKTTFRCTLRMGSSRDVYHRRAIRPRCRCRNAGQCGHQPFRLPYVCWHGHRDFMRALYRLAPDAIIRSGSIHKGGIVYRGAEHFEETHPATGEINIGSRMDPVYFEDACDCQEDAMRRVHRRVDEMRERQTQVMDTHPEEHYGADLAEGAACRAMATALAAIQRERKEVTA